MSNSGFVYPIVMILVGFFFNNSLQYYDFLQKEGGEDKNMGSAFAFIALSFVLGFIFMITPNLYLEYLGKAHNIRGKFCLAKKSVADDVTSFTLLVILAAIALFLVTFKAI